MLALIAKSTDGSRTRLYPKSPPGSIPVAVKP
jgi:hypothetical protein